jgi:hypothetical protein
MKSVVFEKKFSFVQFRNFRFLRSILELIIRSLVNIKKKEEIYFVDKKFKYSSTQFHLNLNYYFFHFLKFFEIYFFCFVVLFRQNDRF